MQEQIAREIEREERAARDVDAGVSPIVAEILEQEVDALAEAFEAQKAAFVDAHARVEQAFQAVVKLAHGVGGDPIFSRIEQLGVKIKAVLAAPDDIAAKSAALSAWTNYAARLAAGDTSATLN